MEEETAQLLNAYGKGCKKLQDLLSEYLERDDGNQDSNVVNVDDMENYGNEVDYSQGSSWYDNALKCASRSIVNEVTDEADADKELKLTWTHVSIFCIVMCIIFWAWSGVNKQRIFNKHPT